MCDRELTKYKPPSLSNIEGVGYSLNKEGRAGYVLTNIKIVSCIKTAKNTYEFKVSVSTYHNEFGQRAYIYLKNSAGNIKKYLAGTQVVYQYHQTNEYTTSVTITENVTAYAYSVCARCDDYFNGVGAYHEDPELWQHTSASMSLTYENPTPVPTAPTSVVLSHRYEQGINPNCSWSGASHASHYDIQRRYYNFLTKSYTAWEEFITGLGASTTSTALTNCSQDYNGVQVRIRSSNSAGISGWTESNLLYHQGVRVWDGSQWCFGHIKIWNGSSWNNLGGMFVNNGSKYIVSK